MEIWIELFYLCVMIQIKGFKPYEKYSDLEEILVAAYENSGKTYVNIASDIGVKTHVTAMNVFNFEEQKVSDEVLSNAMKSIGVEGLIVYVEGVRVYYIKN